MKTLSDIPHLEGVKVLVRADFNVPIANGEVADDYRIRMALPTIQFLRKKKAKVILVSHLEAADGDNPSLEPVARRLEKLDGKVVFVKYWKNAQQAIENELGDGGCILLENLRFFEGEKDNDPKFAEQMASLADIYVNEAFSVSHREHASIVSVPKLIPAYAGMQFEREVTALSKAFNPTHPFLFILGGAKFETKLPLLSKFIDIADSVFLGGALANDVFKAKGYETGISLLSKGGVDLSGFANNPKLMIPVDVVTQNKEVKASDQVSKTDKIMDSGPKSMALLKQKIDQAKFILWNGPLGLYEDGYRGPTLDLAKFIAGASEGNGTESIVGGGDTLAAISSLGLQDKFTFISTAGGAMLDFLAKGTLPGIEALK